MKLLVATLLALACAGWTWDDAHAGIRTVYVVNRSTVVHTTDLVNALPAFQAAVTEDFAPVWGQDAHLIVGAAPPGAWTVTLTDDSDVWFAAGYHQADHGVPYAKVFARTTLDAGDSWQGVLTHELFEMLADPYADRITLAKRLWLVEVADPVEADEFNYSRTAADGTLVPIADFVLPAWYRRRGHGPFDFARHVRKPGRILTGGYVSYWAAGDWHQLFAGEH